MTESENTSSTPETSSKNKTLTKDSIEKTEEVLPLKEQKEIKKNPEALITKYGEVENISDEDLEKEITFNKKTDEDSQKYSWLKIFFVFLFFVLIFNISYIFYIINDKTPDNSEKENTENYTELVKVEEDKKEIPLLPKIKEEDKTPIPLLTIEKTVAKPLEDAIEKALEQAVEKLQEKVPEPIIAEIPKEITPEINIIPEIKKEEVKVKEEIDEKVKKELQILPQKTVKEVEIKIPKVKKEDPKQEESKKELPREAIPSLPPLHKIIANIKEEKEDIPALPIKNPDDYIDVIEMRSVASKIEVVERRRPLSPQEKKDFERQIAKEKLLEQMRN